MKRGSGKQWVEGKGFRLADEVRYIQNKAAEHAGRVVSFGQLILFSTDTGMPGCSTSAINWPSHWLGMAIRNRFTWRRLTLASPSDGRGSIASRGLLSSTPTVIQAGSGPSSASVVGI
jgi:hypothetical protein